MELSVTKQLPILAHWDGMTTPNSENTNEGHSLDRLVGRLGWLRTKGENVRVKIIAVNHDKPCHKCGGPWGTVETQGHAMIGSGMMSLAGTTSEGCLNDVKLDDAPIVGGDLTHEMVEMQEDGGGVRLVSPAEHPDYPRDGGKTPNGALSNGGTASPATDSRTDDESITSTKTHP